MTESYYVNGECKDYISVEFLRKLLDVMFGGEPVM